MNESQSSKALKPSRRQIVKAGIVLASGFASPLGKVLGAQTPATFTRYNVTSTEGQAMLASYQIAIKNLLALPPTDPRNWYRNAFVHLMDCPHMNWWLFPWHRAYIGWFEQTCRELSGNPNFAFPYWDWTATPMIPPAFADGFLNPGNPAFIDSFAAFRAKFSPAMNTYWSSLTSAQLAGLRLRGYNSMADVWGSNGAQGSFFAPAKARAMVPGVPFTDPSLIKAVSIETVKSGLAPQSFVPFSSSATAHHQAPAQGATIGILEGQPHNLVHNDIGGFMEDFLSPVDPIFFLHHSNLERLWLVWTAKQQALGLPTLPVGAPLTQWSNEPFTFFHNSAGDPVSQNTAGSYSTVGAFNYTYTPGSGSDLTFSKPSSLLKSSLVSKATLQANTIRTAAGGIHLTSAMVALAASDSFVVHISVTMPSDHHGGGLNVFLNLPVGVTPSPDRPEFLGSLQMFGMHHTAGASTATFTLPISSSALTAAKLKAGDTIHLQIYPASSGRGPMLTGTPMQMTPSWKVTGVTLGTS